MASNVDIVLAKRPGTGGIALGETFQARAAPVPTAADLQDGQILVEVIYLSLDPVMRKWIQGEIFPIAEGDVMRGPAALRVLASRAPGVNPGDFGTSFNAQWSSVFVLNVDTQWQSFHRVDVPAQTRPSDALGFLGLTGLTGYFGVTKLGRPVAGETFVVSTAAGATGSIAAQVAKLLGARVIGITGSEAKCTWLRDELGLDVALNYKDPNFVRQFADAVGDGVDVYFDNGELDARLVGLSSTNAET
jgi:NADPH-dependent curcumin reductase CurA